MENIRLRLAAALAAIAMTVTAFAAKEVTAAALLTSLQQRFAQAKSVECVFTINGGGGFVDGSVVMAGAKYTMKTPKLSVWYDGRTQWTMLTDTKEVSITEPTAEELLSSNPFAILTDAKAHYTTLRLPDAGNCHRIKLTPIDKTSVIRSFVLSIKKTGAWPTTLHIEFDDNKTVDVVIQDIKASEKKNDDIFRFDAKRFPAYEIIDLR